MTARGERLLAALQARADATSAKIAETNRLHPTSDKLVPHLRAQNAALLEALQGALKHIEAMQCQMAQFVEPSGYTAFDRKRIAFAHDAEAKDSLFIRDMIYLLDGPEQRGVQEAARAAIAAATADPVGKDRG